MKTVYKYYLKDETTTISLPRGSRVVCVHEQDQIATIWVEQETDPAPTDYYIFKIVPTGDEITAGKYVGTCFIGPYVWHIYQTNR